MSNSVRPRRRQPTRLPHPWDSPGKNTGVGCHFLLQYMKVKIENEVAQSCPTLRDPWTATYQAPLSMGFSRQYTSQSPHPLPNGNIIICTWEWSGCTQYMESVESIIIGIFNIIIINLLSFEISRVKVLNCKQCHVEIKQNAFIQGIQEK